MGDTLKKRPPKIQFYSEGAPYLKDLWSDLKTARYSIFIEMYILEGDEVGETLKAILLEKANEGVLIRIMVDAIGSFNLSTAYKQELKAAGVHFKTYHPLSIFSPFRKSLNQRDHRKIILIDHRVAYTGGMNLFRQISHEHVGDTAWRDTQVRLTDNQLISKIAYFFLRNFKVLKHKSKRFERFNDYNEIIPSRKYMGRNPIRRFIQRYIKRSRHFIGITTGYFIPDMETMFHLVKACKRGVKVQIITCAPEHSDVPLVHRIQKPLLKYLMKRGVEIYFYEGRMMHAKTLIFDNKIATVGTTNINYRSFFRDLEINLFLREQKWVTPLKNHFDNDMAQCRRVTIEELDNESILNKGINWLFYLIRSFF